MDIFHKTCWKFCYSKDIKEINCDDVTEIMNLTGEDNYVPHKRSQLCTSKDKSMYLKREEITYLIKEDNNVPHKRSQLGTSQEKSIMYLTREVNYVPQKKSQLCTSQEKSIM